MYVEHPLEISARTKSVKPLQILCKSQLGYCAGAVDMTEVIQTHMAIHLKTHMRGTVDLL